MMEMSWRSGAWLLETRPDRGLLGGMLGWPGTGWSETGPDPVFDRKAIDWLASGDITARLNRITRRPVLRRATSWWSKKFIAIG